MDNREFEKVFWVIQPQLMRYAQIQLDHAAAEDAVQGTLLRLLRKHLPHPTSDGEERRLRALAFEVLNGIIRNEYRARGRRRALAERIGLRDARPETAPDTAAETVERSAVEHWMGQLSVEDQKVVMLFNAGFDTEEIARMLDCTPAAAAKRRTRARERLRAIVEKAISDEEGGTK